MLHQYAIEDTMRKGSLPFKRTIYHDVKKSIEDNSVTFILGARKTGNTVCMKQLRNTYSKTNAFDEVLYVDLKLCDDKESFIDDVIDSICKGKNALILIDEITYIHNADRVIYRIAAAYAETANHNTRVVFAGSQSLALDSWGHSAFAGNAAFITADFLTYPEWLAYKVISEVSEETYAQFVLGTRDFYTYFTSVKDYLQGCLDETIRSNHNAAEKIYGNDCSLVTVEMLLDVLYASLVTLHGKVSPQMDVFLEERYKSLKAMDADEIKQSLQFLYNCGLITMTYVTDDLNISPYICTNLLSPFNDNFQQKYTKSSLMERLNICIAYPMFYVELLHDVLLKVEISYRRKNIDKDEITNKNGIAVYTINNLFYMKSSAYQIRGEIRDLYDICFLCNNYWESLSEGAINALRTFVEYKGIEQFNYIIHMQSDELIDNEKLADDFLKMYDKLGFFYTEEEKYFLVQDKQFKMEKLFPPEYRQGYLRALLDTEKVLQSLELDLQRCKRRITKKILHQALYEIQNNSANLRENIGFLRWNLENERPEWFIPIHKKETMTESNTPS